MSGSTALPNPFYTFFVYIEPLATIGGSIYAWFMPRLFYTNLLPVQNRYDKVFPATQAGIMAVRQLGNCYLIIACMSFLILPRIVNLSRDIQTTTSVLRVFFAILAFCDITHIVATLIDLGPLAFVPSNWNTLTHGNTTLVVVLFAFRMWYFSFSSKLVRDTEQRRVK